MSALNCKVIWFMAAIECLPYAGHNSLVAGMCFLQLGIFHQSSPGTTSVPVVISLVLWHL